MLNILTSIIIASMITMGGHTSHAQHHATNHTASSLHLQHTIQELYRQIEAHDNLRAYKKSFEQYLQTMKTQEGVHLPRLLPHLSHLFDLSILEHLSLSWLQQSPVYLHILLKNVPIIPLPHVKQYMQKMAEQHARSQQILRGLLYRLEKLSAQYDARLLRHHDMHMHADIYTISPEQFNKLTNLLIQKLHAHPPTSSILPTAPSVPSTLTIQNQKQLLHLLSAPMEGEILLVAETPIGNKHIIIASSVGVVMFKNVRYVLCRTGQQITQGEPLGITIEDSHAINNPLTLEFYAQEKHEMIETQLLNSRLFKVQE